MTLRDCFVIYWDVGMLIALLSSLTDGFTMSARRLWARSILPLWLSIPIMLFSMLVTALIWPVFFSEQLSNGLSKLMTKLRMD